MNQLDSFKDTVSRSIRLVLLESIFTISELLLLLLRSESSASQGGPFACFKKNKIQPDSRSTQEHPLGPVLMATKGSAITSRNRPCSHCYVSKQFEVANCRDVIAITKLASDGVDTSPDEGRLHSDPISIAIRGPETGSASNCYQH